MSAGWKLVMMFALITAGCSGDEPGKRTGRTGYMQTAESRFHARYTDCTEIHNYDPTKASRLAENQLAPTERAWQKCVYDAVQKHLIPASKSPDLYRAAISTSRDLTNGIEKGTVTRSQRSKKMNEVVNRIESGEAANAQTMTRELAKRTEFTRRMVHDLRGFAR